MRSVLLFVFLLLACSCGSLKSWGDAELPVTEIEARADTVMGTLKAADLNKDGVIKGDAEWLQLASGVGLLVARWAEEE